MNRIPALIALLFASAALAGCGGTSGPGQGGGSAETEAGTLGQAGQDAQAPGLRNDPIFHEAGSICVNLPIDVLAQQYGVEAEPEAVADAVAADYPPDQREVAKAGCLDVLKQGGRGGEG